MPGLLLLQVAVALTRLAAERRRSTPVALEKKLRLHRQDLMQDAQAERECADARLKKHERLHLRERPPQVQRGKSAHPSIPFTQLNGKRMGWEARHLIRISLYRRVTG